MRNPVVWLAFALSALWVRSAVINDDPEDRYNLLVGYGLVIPGFVMLVHVVLAVLRARAAGTEELLSTVPVTAERRTLGHALSSLAAGALGALSLLAMLVALRPGDVLGTENLLRDADALLRGRSARRIGLRRSGRACAQYERHRHRARH